MLLGVAAYLMWGLFPLYWPLLKPLGSMEILSHRIVWSLGVMVVWLAAIRKLTWFRSVPRVKLAWLTFAAVLVSFNWLLYIWAVNAGHVVETSLGYFINPLMSVLLGVLVLGEKLRRLQWWAMALATVAVLVLSFDYGRPPWIALGLAPSFALYGLVKKRAGVGAVESLSFETAVLFLPAFAYLVWLEVQGTGGFGHVAASKNLLLIGAGVATALPLVCFGAAANRVPLSTVGVLQYIAPSLQFMCGVVIFHESMSPGRWVGFGIIWCALIIFAAESLWMSRRPKVTVAAS
ncbi:MAG: EamA family transporter RarD [Archangium gephyra]|uniref:EamA family transporter RarD n=1 Tax=Archangium gephyra TaxID=48 RepID=A0A2W5V1S9_9BACT|nr:MAG: EamA family transporter RarD [Archangium gephyra]